MRWFWIDRFTEFVSGKRSAAIKNITLAEEAVDDYAPGATFYPASLILEGFAQMGGLMVAQLSDFVDRVILAKISRSRFHFEARPGDRLEMHAELVSLQALGGIVRGEARIDQRLQSEVELMFAVLTDEQIGKRQLFEPAEFCRMLRTLRLFEVGRYEDGRPIPVPQHLQDAERAAHGAG